MWIWRVPLCVKIRDDECVCLIRKTQLSPPPTDGFKKNRFKYVYVYTSAGWECQPLKESPLCGRHIIGFLTGFRCESKSTPTETWAGVNSGSILLRLWCVHRRYLVQLTADTHGCRRGPMMMTTSVSAPSAPERWENGPVSSGGCFLVEDGTKQA